MALLSHVLWKHAETYIIYPTTTADNFFKVY